MHNAYDLIAAQWHAHKREQAYTERLLNYVDRILDCVSLWSEGA